MHNVVPRTIFAISVILLSTQLFPIYAFGNGACCSVTKGSSEKINLSIIGSSAWSHENVGGNYYNLSRQALMAKISGPIPYGFVLQAQVGWPVYTRLAHQYTEMRGYGGIIYGLGLGYELPGLVKAIELYATVNYTRSHGFLDEDVGSFGDIGTIDQTFLISELQGIFLGEISLGTGVAVYTGLRAYAGKNQLKDNQAKVTSNGDREGNLAPLAGFRFGLSDTVSLIVDGGFGHTKVVGVGAIFSL